MHLNNWQCWKENAVALISESNAIKREGTQYSRSIDDAAFLKLGQWVLFTKGAFALENAPSIVGYFLVFFPLTWKARLDFVVANVAGTNI